MFYDGRNRGVCELVLVAETVTRVMYCEQPLGGEAVLDSTAVEAEPESSGDG